MFWTLCAGAGDLDQVAVEEACEGNFVDLKKGFFVLRRSEAPLLAKVCPPELIQVVLSSQ